jgi:hypothetical protein
MVLVMVHYHILVYADYLVNHVIVNFLSLTASIGNSLTLILSDTKIPLAHFVILYPHAIFLGGILLHIVIVPCSSRNIIGSLH